MARSDWDERRMDIIGQNGPTGDHYAEALNQSEGTPHNDHYASREDSGWVDRAKSLADSHWAYLADVIRLEGAHSDDIKRIGFHYRSAFVHGYGHALEDCAEAMDHD